MMHSKPQGVDEYFDRLKSTIKELESSSERPQTTNDKRPIDESLLALVDISKLKEASAALEESIRQRDEFLAVLSHELRNPLSAIVNATQMLAKTGGADNDLSEAVAVIRRQANHMGALLSNLLDVTRISLGKVHLQKRPFRLSDSIDTAIESVRSQCDARNQVIITDVPAQEIWVCGSETRIVQVISNLLTNASKYSGHGLSISLVVQALDDQAQITVKDQGVGIPVEQIDSVFEMFVQSDRTLDRAAGGLGVGLSLVRSLVEMHGGIVSVASDGEGKGSEFAVKLPVCEPARSSEKTAEATCRPVHDPASVVLVEDSPDASKMLAFLLEDAGFQVSIANDGRRGLELIQDQQPDTAVIDIGLPELNGCELAKMIRGDNSLDHVYLIAVTGFARGNDRLEALASGFDEHVSKPVDPDLLHQLISERQRSKQKSDQQSG